MKNVLKVTGVLAGVAAVVGATAYAAIKTEKGRALVHQTKEKAWELKLAFLEKLETETSSTAIESNTPVVAYDFEEEFPTEGLDSVPQPLEEPFVPNRSRQMRERRAKVWHLYDEGFDAEAIAELLNLPFELVLKDLSCGQKRGRIEY